MESKPYLFSNPEDAQRWVAGQREEAWRCYRVAVQNLLQLHGILEIQTLRHYTPEEVVKKWNSVQNEIRSLLGRLENHVQEIVKFEPKVDWDGKED